MSAATPSGIGTPELGAATRLRLTGRGWGLLIGGAVVAVLGELFAVDAARLAGGAIALLPVVAFLIRLMLRPRLEIERTVYPTTVAAGDRLRVIVEVRNHSLGGVPAAAYADTVTGAAARSVGGVLPAIASRLHPREGRRRRRIAYGLTGLRRGIQFVGPLYLEQVDGLALTRRIVRVGTPQQIEVWPQLHDVDPFDIPAQRTGAESEVAVGRSGEADDVITREYRRGDAMRRVHWRATARAGELRVRQEEHHTETAASIMLDTAATVDDRAFELAVSVAASIHQRLHELGYDIEAFATHPSDDAEGGRLDGTRTPATQPLDDMMRRYMLVQPTPEVADGPVEAAVPVARGPVVYVGIIGEHPTADSVVDLAERSGLAIAVLISADGDDQRISADRTRFERAGWQVTRMDASARNPWQVQR